MDCYRCEGNGEQSCTRCGGVGHDENGAACHYCLGDGHITCSHCSGSGYQE